MIKNCGVCRQTYDKESKSYKNSKYYPPVCSKECLLKMFSKERAWGINKEIGQDVELTPYNSEFRSDYEKKFAIALSEGQVLWMYEPIKFKYGRKSYTPDFFLPDAGIFIEVKGLWEGNAYTKFKQFHDRYKDYFMIYLVDREFLRQMGVRV